MPAKMVKPKMARRKKQRNKNIVKFYAFKILAFFKERPAMLLATVGLFLLLPVCGRAEDTRRAELEKQLAEIEKQISQYQEQVSSISQQRRTLENEVSLFDNQIRSIQLQINAINISLEEVELSIEQKSEGINEANFLIGQEKQALAQNIRLIYESDQESLLEVLMRNEDLGEFFNEVNSLQTFQNLLRERIDNIKNLKTELKRQTESLEEQKIQFNQLKVLQQAQQLAVIDQQDEKEALLSQTKGQESNFQKMISSAQKDAASIRQELFVSGGGGSTGALTFEQAYFHAQFASRATGIRPAFLMALIKRETQWGKITGSGNWRTDMKEADRPVFLKICESLNLDPDQMPVSKKPSYGWGGAMGTAQFLPRTWWALKDKIAELTGNNPPNPWDNNDAFTAAAYKLTSNGAIAGNWNAEWKAAQIYFAGGNWAKPRYAFYGNSIMELARQIESQLEAAGLV